VDRSSYDGAVESAYVGFMAGLAVASGYSSFDADDVFFDNLIVSNFMNPVWARRYVDIVSPAVKVAQQIDDSVSDEAVVRLIIDAASRIRSRYATQLVSMVDDEAVTMDGVVNE
jgi:hypothetical protein